MIIQCSQCQARYAVPDQSIGPAGRTVRCSKCQNSWFVSPPAGTEKPLAALETLMQQEEVKPKPKPIPKGSNLPVIKHPSVSASFKATTFGLLATAAALLALVMWPSIYGYPPSRGLALAEVNMFTRFDETRLDDKRPIYEINGKIINIAEEILDVPVLRVTLVDKEGTPLQYWDFSEENRTLEPGGNIPFSTGPLDVKFKSPSRFVVELGNEMELSLRRMPAS